MIGQIHPLVAETYGIGAEVYAAELDFTLLQSMAGGERVFHPLPKFPAVARDLALVCDESLTVGELESCITAAAGKLLRKINLFDIYRGVGIEPGKKSVAFSLELRADDRTLTDEDSVGVVNKVLEKLETAMGTYLIAMSPLVQGIFDMSKEITKRDVDMSGARNLLDCKDIDSRELITFFDNGDELRRLMDDSFSGIHVLFSEEDENFLVGNSSLVSSNFLKDGKVAGHLGVIGPMRLDYKKIIPYVEYFTDKITEILSTNDDIIYNDNDAEDENEDE